MKLNKILAAALIAVSSASSMAAIITNAAGNGELMLVMWDATDKATYTKDLGIQFDSFNGTSNLSYALSDTFFASFLTAANASTSDVRFAVVAGDSAGQRRLLSTFDPASVDTGTPITGSQMVLSNAWLGSLYASLNTVNPANGDHGTNLDGSSFSITPGALPYALPDMPTLQNQTGGTWTTGAVVGTDAGFKRFVNVNTGGTQAIQTLYEGVWSVTNTGGAFAANYTVAAVPEADGIAMALAGFGALGFVAFRRRQS